MLTRQSTALFATRSFLALAGWGSLMSTSLPRVYGQTPSELAPWTEAERSLRAEKGPAVVATLRDQRLRLVRLEKNLVAQRDYRAAEEARRARAETEKKLREWQEVLGLPLFTADENGHITLTAPRAILQGGLAFDLSQQRLVGWTQRGLAARWELPYDLPAGAYEVVIDYSCAPGEGGTIVVKEGFFTLTRKITPSGGWDERLSRALGIIRLQSQAESFVIEAQQLTQSELFRLYQVKLIPVS
jgi:hypothetical protein